MMLHGTTESSPKYSYGIGCWEDFDLPLEAGELGGYDGVQIVIFFREFSEKK